ncbi:MAG: hypothetical protein U9R75_05775 [Candidatus Thermoplasmatota archaeon]|nr:hypothetical protein [Candidatus Thermoplasmatota archaeon]
MDMVPQIPGRVLLSIGAVFLISSATLFTMALLPIIEDGNENLEFVDWINEKRSIYGAMVEKARGFDHMGNVMTDPGTRGDHEVVIEWIREVLPGVEEPVSTPALHDLDNDGDMEVVVISSGDGVMAFKNDGSFYWPAPFTDCVINVLGESASTSGLDFDPPPFFPSAKVFDGGKENGSMIIVPEKDGVLCLDENGQKMWKGGETTGHYFSTPGFTDLEGLFPSDRGEWEIITASDDENRRGWLEALNIEGGTIFRKELPTGGEGSLIGCGVVTADLDGSFWDGPEPRKPEKDEEVRSEIMIGNHDRGLRILQYDRMVGNNTPEYMERIKGMLAGHQTYTTATAGNVSGGPELEIFVGSAEGYPRCWTGWGGKLYAYTPAGVKLWDYTTGSSGASIFSSPALGDVQMSRYDVDEEIVDYEIVFGADTGYVYMLNTMMHNREWSFNTNGRVMSSPAFCDLNSDDELEVVIGSDSGKVFCFDGDPSDGIDEGVPYPGDGPNRDVLWVYDAGCPIGISSPVVGDIDLDGQQEILIGDIKGRVHCISAGGFTAVGRKDWPEFHGNINNTGFISPEKSQNIDLHSRIGEDGEPEPVSVLADPGEIVYFNLTLSYDSSIERVGTEMIMIRVLNRTVPEGWSCSLDTPDLPGEKDPDHVMMVKNTQRDLLFTVQTPEYREVPETACVMIRAYHSENVNVMDKLQIIIHLNVSTGVEVYFDHPEEIDPTSEHPGSKWIGMHPGSYYDVDVLVRNIGTLDDVFDMELVEPPEEVGWNWSFLDNGLCSRSVELSFPRDGTPIVDTEASCTVRIHCPDDAIAGMKVPVTITATSQKSLHEPFVPVRDSDTFLPVVTQENDLRIDVMVQVLQVLPEDRSRPGEPLSSPCCRDWLP